MRALLAAVLFTPVLAVADPQPLVTSLAEPVTESPPTLDVVRLFNTTEVFHLEGGDVRAEARFIDGVPAMPPTLEMRAEVGLTPHFQLNLAEDLSQMNGHGDIEPAATPLSVRYSLGAREGEVFGNPAVELSVIPRADAPLRASGRLLVGGELMPRLVVAGNAYLEQNMDRGTPSGVDGALGLTGGASYIVLPNHIRVGAEGQVGSAEYGTHTYDIVLAGGPDAVFTLGRVSATVSGLFNMVHSQLAFEPTVTLGMTF